MTGGRGGGAGGRRGRCSVRGLWHLLLLLAVPLRPREVHRVLVPVLAVASSVMPCYSAFLHPRLIGLSLKMASLGPHLPPPRRKGRGLFLLVGSINVQDGGSARVRTLSAATPAFCPRPAARDTRPGAHPRARARGHWHGGASPRPPGCGCVLGCPSALRALLSILRRQLGPVGPRETPIPLL